MAYPKFTNARGSIISEIDKTVFIDNNGQRSSRVTIASVSDYTSVDHLIDGTNISPNTYFEVIDSTGYDNLAIQLYSTDATGASFKLYATLDTDATVPATGGTASSSWADMTDIIFEAAITGTNINELAFIDTSLMPDRYLIEYTTQNATNKVDVWVRKY